jgi:hypothetical protein
MVKAPFVPYLPIAKARGFGRVFGKQKAIKNNLEPINNRKKTRYDSNTFSQKLLGIGLKI